MGWFKCNTDGAFYEWQWNGATGAVLRDDQGRFVRDVAKWYDHFLDALTMEAMAPVVLGTLPKPLGMDGDCMHLRRRGRLISPQAKGLSLPTVWLWDV